MRLLKYTAIFSVLSLGLGLVSSLSGVVAGLGWLLGTLLAAFAGASFGMGAPTERAATAGGAVVAAVSTLVGCALATLVGPVAGSVLLQAVTLAFVVGAGGGTFAYFARGERARGVRGPGLAAR